MEPVAAHELQAVAGPPPTDAPPALSEAPARPRHIAPRQGGLLTLLGFMRRNHMLSARYLRLVARLLRRRYLSTYGRRLQLDGLAFIGPDVRFEIGRRGRLELGRWAWIGHGTKLRCHEGVVTIGAKTVLGEECTISAYQRVSIGCECMIADRVMLIDFDHNAGDVEHPIRLQGITKRDVSVGHNVWIGYGASILRGVTVGDNAIIGTGAVVTRDVPSNAIVAGMPARVIRMRETPKRLRWE